LIAGEDSENDPAAVVVAQVLSVPSGLCLSADDVIRRLDSGLLLLLLLLLLLPWRLPAKTPCIG